MFNNKIDRKEMDIVPYKAPERLIMKISHSNPMAKTPARFKMFSQSQLVKLKKVIEKQRTGTGANKRQNPLLTNRQNIMKTNC